MLVPPMLAIRLHRQSFAHNVQLTSLVVKPAVSYNLGRLEHTGTRISPCRINIGSKEVQLRMTQRVKDSFQDP